MTSSQTIPDDLLDRIVAHRPHLAPLVRNLRALPPGASRDRARQFEKPLADQYLQGSCASNIMPTELWKLAHCCLPNSSGYGGTWA